MVVAVAWAAVQIAHNTAATVVRSLPVRSPVVHILPAVAAAGHILVARNLPVVAVPVARNPVVRNLPVAAVHSPPAVAVVRNPLARSPPVAIVRNSAVHSPPAAVAAPAVDAALTAALQLVLLVLSAAPVVYTPSAALPAPAHMVPIVA